MKNRTKKRTTYEFEIERCEPDFDRACDAARIHASRHFFGTPEDLKNGDSDVDLHIEFKSVDMTMGWTYYHFRAWLAGCDS